VNPIERAVRAVDRFQQRNRVLAFPFAVLKKFGDDRAGYLAALIAYYAFFSIFPLLLCFVSILGLVLERFPGLEERIVEGTLANFPLIGDQIQSHSLPASFGAIAVGAAVSLWAGLGVMAAMQNAMNDVWDVPLKDRPNFLFTRVRSLIMLVAFGLLTVVSIGLTGVGSASGTVSWPLRVAGVGGSLIINWVLYMVAFRVLTRRKLRWGEVFPGAVVGAVGWTALQTLGNYLVQHQIARAQETYGTFAIVIGLLVWFYVAAQLSLYAAEINVVRSKRLWPRSMVQPPLSEGDKRSYAHMAQVEQRRPEEAITVDFEDEPDHESAQRSADAAAETHPDRPADPARPGPASR
jgi:YihY family inner membrane protein